VITVIAHYRTIEETLMRMAERTWRVYGAPIEAP
jgi:hypothetical protein